MRVGLFAGLALLAASAVLTTRRRNRAQRITP
jgi:LPXTG-motif cell wall-anchored protein